MNKLFKSLAALAVIGTLVALPTAGASAAPTAAGGCQARVVTKPTSTVAGPPEVVRRPQTDSYYTQATLQLKCSQTGTVGAVYVQFVEADVNGNYQLMSGVGSTTSARVPTAGVWTNVWVNAAANCQNLDPAAGDKEEIVLRARVNSGSWIYSAQQTNYFC